jgi:hypothetical protein
MAAWRLRQIGLALTCGIMLCGIAPALAQDATPTPEDAQKMAIEGLNKLLDALDLFVKSVPQYSAPEVQPNGDIIIRRIHPTPEAAPPKSSAPDETRT